MADNKRESGSRAEDYAEAFLRNLGYVIIKRNFQFGKVGELDIVCCDGQTLVFVEVKARSNNEFGRPEDSINERKRAQIRRLAKAYLYVNGILDVECRYDVIAIEYNNGVATVRHWISAFM